MIKNLVFDMGNVLLDYNPPHFIQTLTDDIHTQELLYREIFRSPEWQQSDAGTITDEALAAVLCARIPDYAGLVLRALKDWHTDLPPIPGTLELLQQLKAAGYPLYLLSNVGPRFHVIKQQAAFYPLMDGVIASSDCKLVKPDRAIFELLLKKFSLTAEECLFVDDNQANVESAQAVGFAAHRFTDVPHLRSCLKELNVL